MPGPINWHQAGETPQMPLAARVVENLETVQFKPVPEKLPEPKYEGPGRIGVPPGMKIRSAEEEADISIKTEPPGLDQLTQRLSEEQLYQSLRDEYRRKPGQGNIFFPEEEPVSTERYTGRKSPPMVRLVEPSYVMHGQLLFEQKNFERYGWDLGVISPGIELVTYYYDLLMMPYHIGSDVCHCADSSAGKCLPGDATRLMLYPERFSVTGLVFEAGTIFGGMFAFP